MGCIGNACSSITNPFKKENLPGTVAKAALAVTITTVAAVVIGALVAQYPQAIWAILGTTGGAALVSFVILVVALTIHCVKGKSQNNVSAHATANASDEEEFGS